MTRGKASAVAGVCVAAKSRRTGFTLIELLIVIAVIAVLLAIASPAMRSVIDTVQLLKCRQNHHQLVTAVGAYAGEWNRWLPFNNWKFWEVEGDPARPGWLYAGNIAGSPPVTTIEAGALWPYLQSHSLYRCPAHKGPYDAGPAEGLTSYQMNGAVTCFWGHFDPHRIGEIRGDGFCFWEANNTDWQDGANLPPEGLTTRHNSGATISCFDGHTERITHEDFTVMVDPDPVEANQLWCAPCLYPPQQDAWGTWHSGKPGQGRYDEIEGGWIPWWARAERWWGDTDDRFDPYFDGLAWPPRAGTTIGRP